MMWVLIRLRNVTIVYYLYYYITYIYYMFRSYDHHQAEKYITTLGPLNWQVDMYM
jgi:hypothetical protein